MQGRHPRESEAVMSELMMPQHANIMGNVFGGVLLSLVDRAAAALIRLVLAMDLAPESARLDQAAYLRLRSRGDTRPASDPQIRRVFALVGAAGFTGPDGRIDRGRVCELVRQVAGVDEPELLTREQVQTVYDQLEELIEANEQAAVARSA